jgi:addiction module HigA family antidote
MEVMDNLDYSRNTNHSNSIFLIPPGETLLEHLNQIGMSQAELAERLGKSREWVNDLVKGREPVSQRTAQRLEYVMGIPADFWLELEASYRRDKQRWEEAQRLAQYEEWAKKFPLRDLRKWGQIPPGKRDESNVPAVLRYFGVASPEEWEALYREVRSVSFRISLAQAPNPFAVAAWLRFGERRAELEPTVLFGAAALRKRLPELRTLAHAYPPDLLHQVQQLCAECGVILVYTPRMALAPINGAARWFRDRPLIQISNLHVREDYFWFTLFHELGHILLHGKKEVFLEDALGVPQEEQKEKEANDFAQRQLVPERVLRRLCNAVPLTHQMLQDTAQEHGIPVGILVGRLQREGIFPEVFGNTWKREIPWETVL